MAVPMWQQWASKGIQTILGVATCVYRRRTYQQVRLLVPVSACIPTISRPQPTWAFRRSTLTPKQVLSVAVLVITFRNAN